MKRDDDALRLSHIIKSIDKILNYTEDIYFDDFENNEMIQDAIHKNLEVIGEAATKLTKTLKQENDHIPWKQIESMRHRLVHDYYRIDHSIIWNTIQNRLPQLRDDIEKLI